jgi:hypothetical protein
MRFKQGMGDWTQYRMLGYRIWEVDFHPQPGAELMPHWKRMEEVAATVLGVLRKAHVRGDRYVLFRHGWSTSRAGATTSRSQVRKVNAQQRCNTIHRSERMHSTRLCVRRRDTVERSIGGNDRRQHQPVGRRDAVDGRRRRFPRSR